MTWSIVQNGSHRVACLIQYEAANAKGPSTVWYGIQQKAFLALSSVLAFVVVLETCLLVPRVR